MTVPMLAGWEHLATVVTVVLVCALLVAGLLAAGVAGTGRAEWQAWLDARSSRRARTSDRPPGRAFSE
jgi:hypothetical protein